jgi:hypothetical protein
MNMNKQNGMTGIGWLFVLGLIGFFAISAMRVVPMYIEGYKVKGALKALNNVPDITQKTKAEVIRTLFKSFDIDDVESVKADDITVTKDKGVMTVEIGYEIRGALMGNLDVVTVFNEKAEFVRH